jgi:hypothetical protein
MVGVVNAIQAAIKAVAKEAIFMSKLLQCGGEGTREIQFMAPGVQRQARFPRGWPGTPTTG